MADQTVTLDVDVSTADAKAGIEDLGKTTKKTTRSMERDLTKVEKRQRDVGKASKDTKRQILEVGQETSRLGSLTGAGLSAASAGFSAATASAESLGGAAIATGGSIAASFAAGGPAMAGIALLTTGLGAAIGLMTRGSEEAQRMAEEIATLREAQVSLNRSLIESGMDARAKVERQLAEQREQLAMSTIRLEKAERRAVQAQAEFLRNRHWMADDAARVELDRTRERMGEFAADALIAADNVARLEGQLRLLDQAAMGPMGPVAAFSDLPDSLEDTLSLLNQVTTETATLGAVAHGPMGPPAAFSELPKTMDAFLSMLNQASRAQEALARRQQESANRVNQSLRQRLEVLRAATPFDEERVRLEQELQRLREAGADELLLQKVQAEELAEIAAREREERERQLAAEKEITGEKTKQSTEAGKTANAERSSGLSVRARRDPSRSIQNFGGAAGGLFGSFPGRGGARIQGFQGGAESPQVQNYNPSTNKIGQLQTKRKLEKLEAQRKDAVETLKDTQATLGEFADKAAEGELTVQATLETIIQNTQAAIQRLDQEIANLKKTQQNAGNIGVAGA